MAERSSYEPGTFCWAELTTTDQAAAKDFYGGLFGWEPEDIPVGENLEYTMMRLRGLDVAAVAPQPQQQRESGMPPVWNSYVSVRSADESAARARELGATVHAGPFDVMESGRMAVIQDPQGAFFELWEPRAHFGAALVNEPGALCWNELSTPDQDAAARFYADLFGWTVRELDGAGQRYLAISVGERANGGIRPLDPPQMPANWLVYFAADELEPSLERVDELGGSAFVGPVDLPFGRFAVLADPQGAVFALWQGELEP
jgi:predicted enzyme related to lactoylglutathione lyase